MKNIENEIEKNYNIKNNFIIQLKESFHNIVVCWTFFNDERIVSESGENSIIFIIKQLINQI